MSEEEGGENMSCLDKDSSHAQHDFCLLFGGNKLNAGVVTRFHEWGCKVIVVDWNQSPSLTGDIHLQLDVKHPWPIIAELERRGLMESVKTGYTSIDVAVPALAEVLKRCGLNVNSGVGLANCSSKSRQTAEWAKAGLLNRKVKKYDSWSKEISEWNSNCKLILKPDNSASSRGITILERASCPEDVQRAFSRAMENASDGLVVVEEFVDGTEFTVEMLGDGKGNVAVYAISKKQHTKNTHQNKIAVKLHYNAVSNALQEKIAEVGIACYKNLGFCNSMGHLEVLLKPDGTISPVEIGARSSGFIASDLVDVVSGRCFMQDLYEVQRGGEVTNGLMPQTDNSSVFFFYDIPSGSMIKHSCSLLDFCDGRITSLASDTGGLVVGRVAEDIDSDNARIGFEVLAGPKNVLTEENLARYEQLMLKNLLGR